MKAAILILLLFAMVLWVAFVCLIAWVANNDRLSMRIFIFIDRVRVPLLVLATAVIIGFLLYDFAPQIKSAIASATRSTPTPGPTVTPPPTPNVIPTSTPTPTAIPPLTPTPTPTLTPTPLTETTGASEERQTAPPIPTSSMTGGGPPAPPAVVGDTSRRKETPMLFGSTMLEVAIGMVFVYLLMSLLCSALNELINALFKLRAKDLENGIQRLLDDKQERQGVFQRLPAFFADFEGAGEAAADAAQEEEAKLSEAFFNPPLIRP